MLTLNSLPTENEGTKKEFIPYFKKKKIEKEQDNNKNLEKTNHKEQNKKTHLEWNSNFEIKKLSLPTKLTPSEKIKKKYKIQLTYGKDGKEHNKTIRFGDIRKSDYIDDQDINNKRKRISKLVNTHNPLHPNFWKLHLLNGEKSDIKENWNNLVSKLK